jgi:outer membrane protein OmpA-like peptidoglycan-associated protein
MKRILLTILFVSFISSIVNAQNYFGIRQSNYAGVMQGDLNPAFLVDNRMKVDVNLFGFSHSTYNNYTYFNTRLMPYWWIKSFDTVDVAAQAWQNDPDFATVVSFDSTEYYRANGKGNIFMDERAGNEPLTMYSVTNVDILNTMITLSETRAIGFGIKHRTYVNVDHIAPEVVLLSTNSLEYPSLWNLELSDQLLNISFNSWMEYHASYAQVVMDEEEHFVKVGGRLKLLQGLGSAYIYTEDVDYNFLNSDTANHITGKFDYGYSDNMGRYVEPLGEEQGLADLGSPMEQFKDIFKFNSRAGFGIDIGGVYEWRPNWKDHKYDMDGETNLWRRNENKYKLRASLAINDIGGMKYQKGELSRNFDMHANLLDMAVFDNVSGFRSFDTALVALQDSGSLTFVEDDGEFYMNLPTSMELNVDYQIWKDFYINVASALSLQRNKDAHKVRSASFIGITPRYDYKWAGVSVPVSYNSVAGFRMGTGLRLGPIFIGTADLKPFLAPTKDKDLYGANFYMALKVPVPYGRVKDQDEDLVSDKLDECIAVPGVWEFRGCPDTDGDHIQDAVDSCIYDPGTPEFNGCPDTDGDKIIDKLDACPEVAGLEEFNGCPDTDGDKIIDKEDDCPEEAGLAEFNGCPDRDEDGIMDKEDDCPDDAGPKEFNGCTDRDGDKIIDIDDLCPDDAGPLENQGCPDTDKDGIFDFLDNCPEKAGPKENGGCPWPDTDEDGILDKDDECPLNPGPKANKGCPYTDTDGDGVKDKDDECVNTPGPVDNNGCPVIEEVDLAIINAAFENLEFETGKSVIKESSHESLDSLASLLVRKPDWLLEIVGHTDNVGAAQNNLILSKQRAQAVSTYLNQRGVPEDRMIVMFFGEEKPIADNNTKEGRQKNRRVEMTIVFK